MPARRSSSDAPAIDVTAIQPGEVRRLLDDLATVWALAFDGPPWETAAGGVEQFRDRIVVHAAPGFRGVVARRGGEVVGFAYGLAAHGPPSPWRRYLAPVAELGVWVDDGFELVELAVLPAWRGRGVGSRLHDHLLGHVVAERAWLVTRPEAEDARRLYAGRRWQPIRALTLDDGTERVLLGRT